MPMVSVIVPVYNAARWLPSTFDSWDAQTYCNVEWVLVDDGSRDGSAELCARWCSGDSSRRRLVRKENGGASSARNVGLDHATGDYVLFWDCDDEQDCVAIEKMVAGLDGSNDLVVCAIRRVEPDGSERDLFTCERHTATAEGVLAEWLRGGVSSGPCSKLVSRHTLVENGIRFEEGVINEDVLWTAEIIEACDAVKMLGDPLYRYIARDCSVTNSFNPKVLDVFDNCRKLEDFVTSHHPSLVGPCACYCARACWNIALTSSRGGNKRRYPEVHRRAMEELSMRSAAVARYCNSPKERVLRLLVRTGIYGLLKR